MLGISYQVSQKGRLRTQVSDVGQFSENSVAKQALQEQRFLNQELVRRLREDLAGFENLRGLCV